MLAAARDVDQGQPRRGPAVGPPGYKMPGGTPASPKLAGMLPAFPANLRKQLKGAPMPAPHHIMCAAVEGARSTSTPRCGSRGATSTDLARGQVAKNMIQAFWFDLNSINAGGSRPDGYEPASGQEGRGPRRRDDGRRHRLRQRPRPASRSC